MLPLCLKEDLYLEAVGSCLEKDNTNTNPTFIPEGKP